jgi:hypothetical protein
MADDETLVHDIIGTQKPGGTISPSPVARVTSLAPGLEITLSARNDDPRSAEFQCVVKIENKTSNDIRIVSLRPIHPPGTSLQRGLDTSVSDEQQRLGLLYSDLGHIVRQATLRMRQEEDKKIGGITYTPAAESGGFGALKKLFRTKHRRHEQRPSVWDVVIHSVGEAEQYFSAFIGRPPTNKGGCQDTGSFDDLKELFLIKLQSAKQLEEIVKADYESKTSFRVDAGAKIERSYVFTCQRRIISAATYNIIFDVDYDIIRGDEDASMRRYIVDEDANRRRYITDITATITPKAFYLSVLAIIAAVLGTLLYYSLPHKDQSGQLVRTEFFNDVSAQAIISAMITALFFYNIYDSTDVGRKLDAGRGWRSALLIGGLSGLVNDKIVQALEALFR